MPLKERQQHYGLMMDTLKRNDVFNWCSSFLDTLRLAGSCPWKGPAKQPEFSMPAMIEVAGIRL
nr:hypothetical protein [Paracoccus sp. (in: a-proteobacteria)]